MTRSRGPTQRLIDWSEDKAPWLHTLLTHEGNLWSSARTILGLALVIGLGVGLLWGLTGQSLDETPVVVIESGSMMHCANGINLHGDNCEANRFGRLGTIDPGDLVFVRTADHGVATFAEDGKSRHGNPGDVIVYSRGEAQAPIIHRAMFWLQINEDGTYDIPELGLSGLSHLDHPVLRDADRWGLNLHGGCRGLDVPDNLGPEDSGYITKGDNNPCWDQGGAIWPQPILPDQIVGKARGEVPWIGLLKLWVFDTLSQWSDAQPDSHNYDNAPGDLRTLLWVTVVALVVVPYGVEYGLKKRRERLDADEADMAPATRQDDGPVADTEPAVESDDADGEDLGPEARRDDEQP